MNQEKIGKFISECRKNKKLTQADLAQKLGVSDKTISNWENGRNMPDLSLFKPLCNELDISINDLLSGEKVEENYQKKFEENIVETINAVRQKRNKQIKKILLYLSVIIIVILIMIILGFISYLEFTQHPVYLSKDMVDIKICDYNDYYIAFTLNVSDNKAAYYSFDSSDKEGKTKYLKVYRYWEETKNLKLLDDYDNGIVFIKKSTLEKIYYEDDLIYSSNQQLEKCE